MHRIEDTLSEVNTSIAQAAKTAGRNSNEITLLGVAKKQSAEKIAEAYSYGVTNIGENYLQEALEKQHTLKHLDIVWHFIGPIQSNKTRAIAENFSWVHSVDRLKIAERLSQQRPPHLPPLNICAQINIDHERSKSGLTEDELDELVDEIDRFPRLKLRGLMVIPRPSESAAEQRDAFHRTKTLLERINSQHNCHLDTLSMGMSNDLDHAIAEGATIVRVGTALFGRRD